VFYRVKSVHLHRYVSKNKETYRPPRTCARLHHLNVVELVWNLMAQAQKPDFVFRRNGRVHLNRRGSQFSRLLAAEVCASAFCNAGYITLRGIVRVQATYSIRQFPLHFPSRASPCTIRFQTSYTCQMLYPY